MWKILSFEISDKQQSPQDALAPLSPVYTHAVLEPVAHGWTIRVPPAQQPYHDREHPSLGMNDRERPPGDFPPALNFLVEAKIRAGSFVWRTNVPVRLLAAVIVAGTGEGVLQPWLGGRDKCLLLRQLS